MNRCKIFCHYSYQIQGQHNHNKRCDSILVASDISFIDKLPVVVVGLTWVMMSEIFASRTSCGSGNVKAEDCICGWRNLTVAEPASASTAIVKPSHPIQYSITTYPVTTYISSYGVDLQRFHSFLPVYPLTS